MTARKMVLRGKAPVPASDRMADKTTTNPEDDDAGTSYEIKVKGHVKAHWSDWLGGLAISCDGHGNSLLTGLVPDQAALYGILAQIRDMGLTLLAVSAEGEGAGE